MIIRDKQAEGKTNMLMKVLLMTCALIFSKGAYATDATLQVVVESHGSDLVGVTLTNVSDESVSVLTWGTAFEEVLSEDLFYIRAAFEITRANPIYTGRIVKRGAPLPEDFIALAAGESVQRYLSLSTYYAIEQQGVYTLAYNGLIKFQTENNSNDRKIKKVTSANAVKDQRQTALLVSEAITLQLSPAPETRAARTPGYASSCTAAQQSELFTALQASEGMITAARDGLAGLSGDARLNSPRYKYWFGEYSPERFQKVLATFNAASNVLTNEVIEFDCRCNEAGLYAYVFKNDPYRIYPCPNFWAARLTGSDSRAGTIVHEVTHFPSVNDTIDHVYGATPVAALAITDPDLAVTNADSYEYFAENTPNIAISNFVVFSEMTIGSQEVNELRVGESSFYKVSGADYVELVSNSGDADLYVYDSAASDNIVCRSLSQTAVDRCDIDSALTAYIEVKGYQDAQYSVVAMVNETAEPQPQPDPNGPVVTTEGGGGNTTGGNSGEEPVKASSGGGAAGWSLVLLLVCRRLRCYPARRIAGKSN